MDSEKTEVQVIEGVTLVIDPAKFQLIGAPITLNVQTNNMVLSFDLTVLVVAGQQERKVENIVTLRSA